MKTVTFEELLLKTAFCCMASDGHIDNREIALIKKMCQSSPLFKNLNFQEEINQLVIEINKNGKEFIKYYFHLLGKTDLTEQEELTLIDFAIQIIKADEQIEYTEVKFFKNIRHRLKIDNENILKVYPDIEMFLEEDIVTESFLDRITNQYLDMANLPQFDLIDIDAIAIDNPAKNDTDN